MNALKLPAALKSLIPGQEKLGLRRALLLAAIFFCGVFAISLHRYFVFYASYDQGLFNQLFWNTLHGRWFQSSLTSANSIASIKDGVTPTVSFVHLGQHFVLDFLLWLPLYGLFQDPVTLIFLQVALMSVGGLVLYALARHYLSPQLSLWITGSYYSAIAVITPTLDNFYEHCQIPLFAFGTLLAMEKQRWGWFWLCALFVLGVREEAGVILFGIGAYMLVSRRHPRTGLAVCLVSFAYMAVVTNFILPQFSTDSSRLYLANRFKQFVDSDSPTTMQVLWGMLTRPIELFKSIFTPLDRRINYLLGHFVPLALIPALSGATWTIAGIPILSLFVQSGKSALSIQIRYAVAIVPGVFYGAVLWWSQHPQLFTSKKFRRFWQVCIAISLIYAVIGTSVNRSLSFILPDSIRPWVYVPITRQWSHASHIYNVIRQVPPDASVTATTYLVPHLSTRREMIRLPALEIYNDQNQKIMMDYAVADFWQMREYIAFNNSRTDLRSVLPVVERLVVEGKYGMLQTEDGVVLLGKNQPSKPEALAEWEKLSKELQTKAGEKSG